MENRAAESNRIENRKRNQREHRPVAPAVVIPQPVYFSVPQRCVVPGYYDNDALWVEAHDEPRAYTWGYYQPYWVPENAC